MKERRAELLGCDCHSVCAHTCPVNWAVVKSGSIALVRKLCCFCYFRGKKNELCPGWGKEGKEVDLKAKASWRREQTLSLFLYLWVLSGLVSTYPDPHFSLTPSSASSSSLFGSSSSPPPHHPPLCPSLLLFLIFLLFLVLFFLSFHILPYPYSFSTTFWVCQSYFLHNMMCFSNFIKKKKQTTILVTFRIPLSLFTFSQIRRCSLNIRVYHLENHTSLGPALDISLSQSIFL